MYLFKDSVTGEDFMFELCAHCVTHPVQFKTSRILMLCYCWNAVIVLLIIV